MPYTFGAGTGDDITCTATGNIGGSGAVSFVAGWWYPTTLTATRGLWSAGNTVGAEIDTTTSELRLRTDNTTDGQWTTSGAGITTNKWWFLAFLNTCSNTGPAAAWRLWIGDEITIPQLIVPTQAVAPSGNFTGSTSRTLGNKGTGTLAFQGVIGWVVFVSTVHIGPASTFGVSTAGALDAISETITFMRHVSPMWLGVPVSDYYSNFQPVATFSVLHLPLNSLGVGKHWSSSLTPDPVALTVNGATYSESRPPIVLPESWPNFPVYLSRRSR